MTKSLPPKSFVLYADDDQDDIQLVEEVFREHSEIIELLTFSTGKELLGFIQRLPAHRPKPCLVIIDINMPGLNGKEVLKEIREVEEFQEVPVVLFSTSNLPSEAAFARSFDAGFITKPLNREQIHHIFDDFIEHCSEEVKRRINWKRNRGLN